MKPRGCDLCQRTPATKCGCGLRLCPDHESVRAHDCAYAKKLDEIAGDPKKRKAWLAANAGEEAKYTEVETALNAMPELEMAWQSRKRGGVRANDAARSVGDFTAIARGDGRHVEVELKGSHKDGCGCDSCRDQRDHAERVRGAGGVYVGPVRSAREAVDGVKLSLAMARGRERRAG